MDCAEEIATLRREIAPLAGGEEALSFDLLNGKLTIRHTTGAISLDEIVEAVAQTGMRAEPWAATGERDKDDSRWQRHRRALVSGLSGCFLVAGFISHGVLLGNFASAFGSEGIGVAHEVPNLARIFYGSSILAGLWLVLPRAWVSARRFRPDMNLLMTIAVFGAIGIGEWFEAGAVAFLFAVSLALESWSVERARRAVAALMDLSPVIAHLVSDGERLSDVSPEDVGIGSRVLVKPGERIPLDGVVVDGASSVNQAPITGESVPVDKCSGADVYAGTINGDGALTVETTKAALDTTLAHIIQLVEEAQANRAPSEQWVDRFARIYTPVVMALALGVLVLPPLFFAQDFDVWFYRALVLLVIACPCALVISTPVSIVASLASAAREGVLIKGGRYLEVPAHLVAIALDKTGTLTEGRPRVVELVPLNGHSAEELLARAAAMEAHSNHPLARAILQAAEERGISTGRVTEFQVLQGRGATARIDGKEFWLGSHRFLEERGQETREVHDRLKAMSAKGRSVVIIGNERHACGLIALADGVRHEAAQSLRAMKEMGIRHIVMLTGDNQATAQVIGQELGLDEVIGELLPEDKVRAVEDLVDKYGTVAMIGDGINDAPAMACASLGIAMGAAGSDAAIETAHVALMSDDLSRIPWLIAHSKRTLRTIRQNISLSLTVKVLFVALTFLGFASLWGAIMADMGTSLLVIFNGLRLATDSVRTSRLSRKNSANEHP